jgi:hypothetical protein
MKVKYYCPDCDGNPAFGAGAALGSHLKHKHQYSGQKRKEWLEHLHEASNGAGHALATQVEPVRRPRGRPRKHVPVLSIGADAERPVRRGPGRPPKALPPLAAEKMVDILFCSRCHYPMWAIERLASDLSKVSHLRYYIRYCQHCNLNQETVAKGWEEALRHLEALRNHATPLSTVLEVIRRQAAA